MSFFSFRRRPHLSADDRLGRLRLALDRAKIRYSETSPERALGSLPPAPPPAQTTRIDAESFRFPLAGPVRLALLEGTFRPDKDMREFTADDLNWLQSYAPEALVAPLDLALSLADRRRRGRFDLPSLKTAIVVLTSFDSTPLADRHRDLLWQAFGVPVFEQLRGWDGAVLARECEVHDGLHIDDRTAIFQLYEQELLVTELGAVGEPIIRTQTGLTGEIATGLCECGAETPRLRRVSPVRSGALHSRAALAAA